MTEPRCAPLCAASKAYGPYDRPWKHEPNCPVRIAWEKRKVGRPAVNVDESGADDGGSVG